ncbi:hypothetical protein, partial [Agrococcus sp. HG114]|uniref:hypothetical protein n=1 Tax=Agrococcus sp. HG114 TaxID=2969757 RepID=UPI00215A3BED
MRDLRLALPVAIAWAALAALSPHPAALGTAAIASAGVAIASLVIAQVLARGRSGRTPGEPAAG